MVAIRTVFFKFLLVSFVLVGSYLLVFASPRVISHLTPFTEKMSSSRWNLISGSESGSRENVLNDYYRNDIQYKTPSESQSTTNMSSDALFDQASSENEVEATSLFTENTIRQDSEAETREVESPEERDREAESEEEKNQEVESLEERNQEAWGEEEWDQDEDEEQDNQEAESPEERGKVAQGKEKWDQEQDADVRENQEQEDQEDEGLEERDQVAEVIEEWDQERENQEEDADVREDHETEGQEEMDQETESQQEDVERREDQDEEAPASEDPTQSANAESSQEMANSKSAGASEDTIRSFQETMRERFKQRRAVLQAACAKNRGSLPAQARTARVEALFFVKKYNFLTCLSPKVGTTTWKTHLLRMWGYEANFKTPHKFNKFIGIGYNKSLRKTYRSSKGLTRVVTVRHPLSRLASAFRNKLGDGKAMVPPSHHIYDIFRMVLGHSNIKAFRWKANQATFLQFLNYVISETKSNSINPHWRPYLWTCRPCGMTYDYIVKLETFGDDLLYLATAAGIKEINTDLRKNQSPALEEKVTDFEEYFEDLPPQVLKDIYQIYKYDFLFFGYDVPEAMLKASQEDS